MAEEKEEVVDKKAEEKQRKKEEAKQKKAQHAAESDELEEESGGSKVAVFFVSLLIIVVWFAIIALLIKWDVGGFGSGVLAPILKDVPYVNKILPDDAVEQVSTEDSAYAYDTMADAVERIKELEKELADAQNASSANADYISQLEAQSQELQQYKENEAEFEKENLSRAARPSGRRWPNSRSVSLRSSPKRQRALRHVHENCLLDKSSGGTPERLKTKSGRCPPPVPGVFVLPFSGHSNRLRIKSRPWDVQTVNVQ